MEADQLFSVSDSRKVRAGEKWIGARLEGVKTLCGLDE